jgi:hypothetical protein
MNEKSACFVLSLLLAAAFVLAQQIQQNEAPLTNKDVLQMISIGLSEGVIVDKIHAARATNFDISVDALKSLKDAKVPDAVMQAMIQASSAAHASNQPIPNPDDPASPHDAGVWVLVNGKMMQIEASSFSGQKTGAGSTMLTMGMKKSHFKSTLRNAHAVVQLTNPNPEFYFYFDKSAAAPTMYSFTGPAPTSPSEYQLVRLEVKKDTRETVVMTMGGLGGGMSSGPEKKDIINFSSVKIESGIFKVSVGKPLAPGEYCFTVSSSNMGGAMMGGGQVYDFGVSTGSK